MEGFKLTETTLFWPEVSAAWLPLNPDWPDVIDQMPDRISPTEVSKRLQSTDQLLDGCPKGTGYINGKPVERSPDRSVLEAGLRQGPNPENLWFQILYQFCIAEGVCTAFSTKPLGEWPAPFLNLLEDIFQFMVYMSAILYLEESGDLDYDPLYSSGDWIKEPEPDVRKCVGRMINVSLSKGADYGQSYRRHGLPGLLPRIWDKLARYMKLKSAPSATNYESFLDSAHDLLGYSIIAWSLILELETVTLGTANPEGEI